ncbi:MAG TPA: biotin/lipoyl-binding protein, partial [Longimicrobiales bacterium]|nr:biotin/lipoyl-binding protein [Longimicrobiales bacterium]
MGTEPSDIPPGRLRAVAGRRRVFQIVAGVVTLALLVWGGMRLAYARGHESTDDAYVTGDLVPVLAKVEGYVARVEVRDDEHVDAGQLLLRLEDDELRHRLDRAEAELAAARAAVGDEGGAGRVQAQVEQARRA